MWKPLRMKPHSLVESLTWLRQQLLTWTVTFAGAGCGGASRYASRRWRPAMTSDVARAERSAVTWRSGGMCWSAGESGATIPSPLVGRRGQLTLHAEALKSQAFSQNVRHDSG